MNRPEPMGFQKPLMKAGRTVGLAMITEPVTGALTCSCEGFTTIHPRRKVREDKAQRHIDKAHGGRGVWL